MKEDYMLSQSTQLLERIKIDQECQTDYIEKNWRTLDKETQTEGEEVKDNDKARKSEAKKKSTEVYDIKLTWSDSIIDKALKLLKKDRLSVTAVFKQFKWKIPIRTLYNWEDRGDCYLYKSIILIRNLET